MYKLTEKTTEPIPWRVTASKVYPKYFHSIMTFIDEERDFYRTLQVVVIDSLPDFNSEDGKLCYAPGDDKYLMSIKNGKYLMLMRIVEAGCYAGPIGWPIEVREEINKFLERQK